MWYLISSKGKRIYLTPNKELTFGRKKSDILLQNDESISRLHASICIEPKDEIKMNEPISICKLKDIGSKYGTYILLGEDERIEVPKEGYNLKDQDKIRFGLQHHVFTVVYVPLITVASALSDNDKNKLQSIINEIDGMISNEWTSNCTHLTVSKATLTEKVTWAMASAAPIVTLSYWEQVKSAIDNGEQLPKAEDFVPLIGESLVNKEKVSLRPNIKRKMLFKNLIFVHFSVRQYKTYGKMISLAGGKSLLYSKKPLSHKELCAPNVIVLQYPNDDATQSTIVSEYDSIYNVLRARKRKMISESDIPLAILHCSVEKYCNPTFKFGEFLKRSQSKSDSSEVLVLDTQDVTSDVRVLPKVISNVPLKPGISIKNPKQTTKIIPESYDTPSSNDLLIDNNTCGSQGLRPSTQKKGQETRDTPNSDISVVQETVQNSKKECSEKFTKYIPETNDSSVSDMTQKDTQYVSQEALVSREQNTDTQNIEILKESMIANKGTPFNEVIDLSAEEAIESKGQSTKCNENSNKISAREEKSCELFDVKNGEDRNLEIETINVLERHNRNTPRKNRNLPKNAPSTMKEIDQESRKRSKDSSEFQSDEEFLTSTPKRICSEELIVENTEKSSEISSIPSNEEQTNQNNCHNLSRNTSSILRASPNYKRFKKVYTNIPKKRITLSDMYVWKKYNVQNLLGKVLFK